MSKIIIATTLAILMWMLPAQSMAALEPHESPVLRAYLEEGDAIEAVTPASARFSIHIGRKGTFVFGRFGGYGYNRFGNKGYHPYRPYRFGGYYGNRYDYKPFFDRYGELGRDRFFYDRNSRFFSRGFSSPYYSPFGTRRPGW